MQVNEALTRITGYSEQELLGSSFDNITHPDDRATDHRNIEILLGGGVTHLQWEKRYIHKQGHTVWIQLTVTLVRDSQGNPAHFIGQQQDITRRKQSEEEIKRLNEKLEQRVAERTAQLEAANRVLENEIAERARTEGALRASEERFRTIVSTAQEGVWVLDADGNTEYANQRMADLLGYTIEEMQGRTLPNFLDKSTQPDAALEFDRRREGMAAQTDFRFLRKDGTELWAIISTNPLYGATGEYTGLLVMVADITERKYSEEEKARLLSTLSTERLRLDTLWA